MVTRRIAIFAMLILAASFAAAAGDVSITGTITDVSGKPLRGAVVKAVMGPNSVGRLTDSSGKYRITGLNSGDYDVQVMAYGFANQSKKGVQGGEASFSLKPRWDVTRLSTAEVLSAWPEDKETRFVRANCTGCHTFFPILQKKGSLDASQWEDLISRMGTTTGLNPQLPPARLAFAGKVLEKYFGPDSPEIAATQVKHAEPSDEALKATWYEFRTPTPTKLTHSIVADNKGNAWFTEYDWQSNRMAKLDFANGKIEEFPIATPNSAPHTPIIDKEGLVWTPLADGNKLTVLDPKTNKITEYPLPLAEWGLPADKHHRPHTPALDAEGNVWLSHTTTNFISKFDRKTKKFERFDVPVPKEVPEESQYVWAAAPGEKPTIRIAGSYDIAVDSKGKLWYTQLQLGKLVSFDPKSKESAEYKAPGVISSRGLTIDAQDNVWFSNWEGHTIVKLDQKTGQMKQYQPPTKYASPYGMVFDKAGVLWFADHLGNNITKFNPKTERFIEYPIPAPGAMPRFISVDDQGRVYFTEWWLSKVGVLVPDSAALSSSAR